MRELSGVSMVRTLISLVQAPPSRPRHLSKAPPLDTTAVGTRVLCVHFMEEGDTGVQSIAGILDRRPEGGYHQQLIMTAA